MATPANYATLIAEIDALIDDYTLTLQQVTGGLTVNPPLERLIDLRYKLFEAGGGGTTAVTGAQLTYTEAQLTAAGQATTSRSKVGYPAISISYTVALNGSTSVTVRCEVSNDGTNWLNANLAGTDTTQTTSGTFGFVGVNQYQFVRFLFVSEAGGTGATINVILTVGQGFDSGNGLVEVTNLPSSLGVKSASQSLSVVPVPIDSLAFPVLFERTAGTFINATAQHDCCEFLTGSAGQEAFTQITTAVAMEVVSTSANDTAAGTGARTVGIIYNNASGTFSQTTVTLNGTTPVPLAGITATAIQSMSVLTTGSGGVAAGTINLRAVAAPTTIYEQVVAGGNRSQSGRFTVPTGFYANVLSGVISVQGQAIEIKVRATFNDFDRSTTQTYLFKEGAKLAAGASIPIDFGKLRVSAGQTIKVSAVADATGGNPRVHGTLNLELIAL